MKTFLLASLLLGGLWGCKKEDSAPTYETFTPVAGTFTITRRGNVTPTSFTLSNLTLRIGDYPPVYDMYEFRGLDKQAKTVSILIPAVKNGKDARNSGLRSSNLTRIAFDYNDTDQYSGANGDVVTNATINAVEGRFTVQFATQFTIGELK